MKTRSELYAQVLTIVGNIVESTGKHVPLYKKLLMEGLKAMPSDETALNVLEYCVDASTEAQRGKLITEGTFGLVSLRARPLHENEKKVTPALWSGSDKVSSLFESGSWTNESGEPVKPKTLLKG